MSYILECVDLSKQYSDGTNIVKILKGVNFKLESGSSVAILGPSGSGKSTLLHILAGLDTPTSGKVMVGQDDIQSFSEKKLCKLRNETFGFVYQQHHLLKDFSVVENVIMPMLIKGLNFKKATIEACELLSLFDMQELQNNSVTTLSGGEKQRVAILRAMANNPSCILADEPTGNLCQSTANLVYESLLRLKQEFKMSLVVVTHDINLAKKMDHVYRMENGKLVLS